MFDALLNQARAALQSAAPADVADATKQHVEETDPATLQQHLTDSTQTMSGSSLAQLATTLIGQMTQRGTTPEQLNNAGVPVQSATQGDQAAVIALIQHVAQDPSTLRASVVQFVENDPQVITQLPGLVEGVLQKLR